MAHLPFDFSIDFEKRQQEEAARIARQQEEAGTMLNTGQSSSTQTSQVRVVCVCVFVCTCHYSYCHAYVHVHLQTPQRSVVVKTHAATGQRLTAGNVINAVWETSPVPDMEELDNTDETSSMDVKQKVSVCVFLWLQTYSTCISHTMCVCTVFTVNRENCPN